MKPHMQEEIGRLARDGRTHYEIGRSLYPLLTTREVTQAIKKYAIDTGESKFQDRACGHCGKTFRSERASGAWLRYCVNCKSSAAWKSGNDTPYPQERMRP